MPDGVSRGVQVSIRLAGGAGKMPITMEHNNLPCSKASGHTDLFRLRGRKVVAQRDVQVDFNLHGLQQFRQHACVWTPASAESLAQQRRQNLSNKGRSWGYISPVSPFQ